MMAGIVAGGRPLATAASTSAHSRWRILISAGMNPNYVSVAELSIRATAGGSNQCAGGTPAASAEYDETYSKAKAFDGIAGTMWAKAGVAGSWLGYIFPAPVECKEVAVTADNWGFAGNIAPTNFTVQYSDDGAAWFDHWSVSGGLVFNAGETTVYTKP